MPNGPMVRGVPQLEGSKDPYKMNKIDREGLGPWIVNYKIANPTHGYRKISDAILAEFQIHVAWREIGNYLTPFRDPITGEMCNLDLLPKLPDRCRFNTTALALNIKEILEESEISDVETLETLTYQGLEWFKNPDLPIPLKLKVAKELRETIKLKMELGGISKPNAPVTNNNLIVNSSDIAKMLEEKPEALSVLRDLLYLANRSEPQPVTIEEYEDE